MNVSDSSARLSSASTESDFVPANVPFHWEVAPGRPAVRQPVDPPSLPLPPGKRPKDGFYLPFPRPAQSPPLDSSDSRERRPFNLRFPGSSNKPFSRKSRDDMGGGFTHVSGHRFGSKVARRALVELQKRRSCLGACLSTRRKSTSSHSLHQPGRNLDSMQEPPAPSVSTDFSSGSSPTDFSSGSSHDHDRPNDSSGARQQSQTVHSQGLRTSRFMASMLMSLCPADEEPDHKSDEEEAVDDNVESFSTDHVDNRVTMPRARVSSPEAPFQAPHEETHMKAPQNLASPSHQERIRAWVDLSTDMSRCNLSERTLHKEPTQCECCGTKLPQRRALSWKPRAQMRTSQHDPNRAVSAKSYVPKRLDFSKDPRTQRTSASTVWQEALRSSPAWPNRSAITSTDDESGEDSDTCNPVSPARHMMPSTAVPPNRAATWEVSGELLKSSSMLKYKQELQQDQSPRSSFNQESSTRVLASPNYTGSAQSSKPNSCGVMDKVAHFEAKARVESSSGKSWPPPANRGQCI